MNISYRQATERDYSAIRSLLESQKLPTETIGTSTTDFYLAIENEAIAGVAGFEYYGEDALLRSVLCQPRYRRNKLAPIWLIGCFHWQSRKA